MCACGRVRAWVGSHDIAALIKCSAALLLIQFVFSWCSRRRTNIFAYILKLDSLICLSWQKIWLLLCEMRNIHLLQFPTAFLDSPLFVPFYFILQTGFFNYWVIFPTAGKQQRMGSTYRKKPNKTSERWWYGSVNLSKASQCPLVAKID